MKRIRRCIACGERIGREGIDPFRRDVHKHSVACAYAIRRRFRPFFRRNLDSIKELL